MWGMDFHSPFLNFSAPTLLSPLSFPGCWLCCHYATSDNQDACNLDCGAGSIVSPWHLVAILLWWCWSHLTVPPRVSTLGGHFALEAWCCGWWAVLAGLHWLAGRLQPVMSSRQLAPPLVSSHSSPSSLSFPSKLIFVSHFFLSLLLLSLAHILFPSKNFDIRFIHPVGQPHVHLILHFCLFPIFPFFLFLQNSREIGQLSPN